MSLTPIPLKTEVEAPAVQAKTFDSMWIKAIQVRTPSPDMSAGSIYIEYVPMVAGTGETLDTAPVELRTDKLWLAAGTVPEVGVALGALLAAIRPLEDFIEEQNGNNNTE